MGLWTMHRMFIGAAILLCLVYGAHECRAFASGDVFALARSAAAAAGAVVLAIYFYKLSKRGRPGGP